MVNDLPKVITIHLFENLLHLKCVCSKLFFFFSNLNRGIQLLEKQRHKMFESLLHLVDIAHPGKPWQLHHQWSVRVSEEFYRQGDEETELQVPVSPLCDRNNNNFPTSQISKIPKYLNTCNVHQYLRSLTLAHPSTSNISDSKTCSF